MVEANTCATCAHWDRGGAAIATAVRDPSAMTDVGACCIMPPQLVREGPYWATAAFPQTHASRGCGEWEPEGEADDGGGERAQTNVVPFDRGAA